MAEESRAAVASASVLNQASEAFSAKYEHLLNEVETTEGQLGAILR